MVDNERFIPHHRSFQKITAYVDIKTTVVVVLLGICLILSSKAIHDVNNRVVENTDGQKLYNETMKEIKRLK